MEPGPTPDLEEIRRSEHAGTEAWDEVEAAVLARSAGRSRAEVRQMLIAELQSRNRPVPDDRLLDLRVEQVTFAPQPLAPDASALTALKALAGMVRQGRAVHKKAAAMRGKVRRPEGPRGQPPYLVEADHSLPMADVILGPGASAILDSFRDDIIVSLERDPAEGSPAAVVVYSGKDRVGTLSPANGGLYQPALDAAQRAGRSLMVHGIVSRTPGASLQLQVSPAGVL